MKILTPGGGRSAGKCKRPICGSFVACLRNMTGAQKTTQTADLQTQAADRLIEAGNRAEAEGRYREACEKYRAAVDAAPPYAPALLKLGIGLAWARERRGPL